MRHSKRIKCMCYMCCQCVHRPTTHASFMSAKCSQHTGALFMLHHRKYYMNLRRTNVVSAHTSDLRLHWSSAFAIGISLLCDKNTNVGRAEWVYQFRKCHSQRERKLINEHRDSNGLKWMHTFIAKHRKGGEARMRMAAGSNHNDTSEFFRSTGSNWVYLN